MNYDYPFTAEEAQAAYDEWGCNCGPSALAFALQVKLDAVKDAIPGFAEKRYTSPSMMKAALASLGRVFSDVGSGKTDQRGRYYGKPTADTMFLRGSPIALVRVQWTGPWTQPGANVKWAYRQTHWIATWIREIVKKDRGDEVTHVDPVVFDINSGILPFEAWEMRTVPLLTKDIKRADGGWFPTHVWRLQK